MMLRDLSLPHVSVSLNNLGAVKNYLSVIIVLISMVPKCQRCRIHYSFDLGKIWIRTRARSGKSLIIRIATVIGIKSDSKKFVTLTRHFNLEIIVFQSTFGTSRRRMSN